MKKEFKGQYSGEKILFKIKENLLSFIFSRFWIILSFVILITIISIILFYFGYDIYVILLIVISIILIILYYWLLYKDSYLYFTSRRVVKQIRNGIFFRHRKELKIMDIKSSMSNKKGFLQTILRIGNLKIEGTDDKGIIYFSGVKEYEAISNYIGRVIDYIKLNGHTDNIARYQNKKQRENGK